MARRTGGAVHAAAAVVAVAAMIATPLAARGGPTRRSMSSVVVTSMFVATTARAARRWGARRAGGAAATIALATGAVERIGTHTGVPFGRYGYTETLRPQLAGVPAIVPLAWFAMAVPARETAHAALGHHSTPTRRIALGAAALTAWDLFLDPQMVGEGYWRWARQGAYRGIPLTNYVGWFVTGLGVMTALESMLPPERPDPVLVGQYSYMGVMETVGFAAFFRDRTVATVGGAAMLPVAAIAVRRLAPRRHRRTIGLG
ncbi:MAG: carotenoid biosynthesis protein [Ilumatobacter sp.]|nr:MAG: carotenoid biosynthesis protein [Ilumatobacter sp.]